ncbi:lea domain-containing protein [Aspergillus ellipticus CBS 707.79]|uniref:Lea domain-containing protein n=1 Tax=Aspergillus ellipticus CBS 707.79 TaxID=1448320 RepID=A0A319E026_9EURO|nr:lea domain-containing protein [Aspergillus ellipticus CBS 707.79]
MSTSTTSLPPVPPLPTPQLQPLPGVSLLLPLSRRGTGPELIMLVPDLGESVLAIEHGIPSPLIKWAEESYVVAAINASALKSPQQARELLLEVTGLLNASPTCDLKDKVGLVAYHTQPWSLVGPVLNEIPIIKAVIVYGTMEEHSNHPFRPKSTPTVQHLAGKAAPNSFQRRKDLMQYTYPETKDASFAVPFHPGFHYNAEAVSHTRNLTFLKENLGGPFFDLEQIWDKHTYYEFENRSVEHTMSTMVQEPYVNHVPTLTGGIGRKELTEFYRDHFIWKNPKDTTLELISRTIGIDRVVDEFIFKFRHDAEVDWLIPGIPPTHRDLEIPFMAVVNIRGDRLYHEHITWDQGSLLMQLVPVFGKETAAKLRDKNAVTSNGLFANLVS